MKVRISRSLLEQIMSLAAADPDEVCGLLLGERGAIHEICPAANVAADPARQFELDPAVLIAAYRSARSGGLKIIGHYHSHPSGVPEPSAVDAASAVPDDSLWLILARDEARLWLAGQGESGKVGFVPVTLDIM